MFACAIVLPYPKVPIRHDEVVAEETKQEFVPKDLEE
jgi:hypothetical protein